MSLIDEYIDMLSKLSDDGISDSGPGVELKDKQTMTIDGEDVIVSRFKTWCGPSVEVSVGTNGYHGGDGGHGSRTYLEMRWSGADGEFTPTLDKYGEIDGFRVILDGDLELMTIVPALLYAAHVLEAARRTK